MFDKVAVKGFCGVFYPRDSMLARVLVMALCLSVCVGLSVSATSRSSVETAERIGLVFGMGAFFDLSYTAL